jgi:hypothetical protein
MMTDLSTYTDLITSQHADKPNFLAVLGAALQPLVDAQNTLLGTPSDHDIDVAIGRQLDVIGAWVGLARRVVVPIGGVYFSNDAPGVGLDQGIWYQTDDPTVAVSELDDETYRAMLKIRIAANSWDGTLAGANAAFASISATGVTVTVQDNFDMSFTLLVAGDLPNALYMNVLRLAAEWVRPAGVALSQVLRIQTMGAVRVN